jgi:hypothetical protein
MKTAITATLARESGITESSLLYELEEFIFDILCDDRRRDHGYATEADLEALWDQAVRTAPRLDKALCAQLATN